MVGVNHRHSKGGKNMKQSFNLVSEPWIKVSEVQTNQVTKVSLLELFEGAGDFRELAGDMRAQDLAILRFLLAILTTVYSRFDANDEMYEWLERRDDGWALDEDIDVLDIQKDFLKTWKRIYKSKGFTSLLFDYLKENEDSFDLLSKENPFYQVTESVYDSFVPANKKVSLGKGTVSVKQINRLISESNNSPSVFSPKTSSSKEKLTLDEFSRWLISYQNFTGVTDKTKINAKESVSSGWLYSINPVLAKGSNMFETLMLNLVLDPKNEKEVLQRPVWEFPNMKEYINERMKGQTPSNIAELYTVWSRMLHVKWDEKQQPIIFTAGLSKNDGTDMFVEPMTTWKYDPKEAHYRPATKWIKSLGKSMWRNFGQYVQVESSDDVHEPGIVKWLRTLQDEDCLPEEMLLNLETVGLVSDGNATSQSPAAEVYDNLRIEADVLFDENAERFWPGRIEGTIKVTQKVGDDFWSFARNLGELRGLDKDRASNFAGSLSSKFYDSLNKPFNDWLANLRVGQEPDEEINMWKKQLRLLALDAGRELVQAASPRDISGVRSDDGKTVINIFVLYNQLERFVYKDLK